MSTVEKPTGVRTHEVTNQPPPLVDYNVFEADTVMKEAVQTGGRRLGGRQDLRGRRDRRARRRDRARPAGEREPAEAPHPRPLREPGRHPRVPSLLARADAARHLARAALAPLARAAARRPRRPRGGVHVLLPGRGRRRLSDLDDLLGRPRAPQAARAGRGVGAADPLRRLRPAADRRLREGGLAVRHGDDGEAGRLRRPREHDRRQADQRRRPRRRSTRSPATSGSSPRRSATRSSSSPRPRAASPAS